MDEDKREMITTLYYWGKTDRLAHDLILWIIQKYYPNELTTENNEFLIHRAISLHTDELCFMMARTYKTMLTVYQDKLTNSTDLTAVQYQELAIQAAMQKAISIETSDAYFQLSEDIKRKLEKDFPTNDNNR